MKRRDINAQKGMVEITHHEPPKREDSTGKQRVAAYCRVSTLQEEQELSYETQRAYYEELIAQRPDMVLVGVYGDQGQSGLHTDKRAQFKQMVHDALDGKIDVIMVKSISRFSRNTAECLGILRKFKEKGIQVIFEKEGLNSLDPKMEMVLSIFASIAQNESANISENVRWAIQYRNKSGKPSRIAPYGYRSQRQLRQAGTQPSENQTISADGGGQDSPWEIEPNEAERVEMMFMLASQGFSITRIAKMLNTFEEHKDTGYRWNNEHVLNLLRNEVYKGDVLTNKSVQPDYLVNKRTKNRGQARQYYISDHHPAIVKPAVFDRVQELLEHGVLFANRPIERQAYIAAHPELKLTGAELHGTRRASQAVAL